MFYYEECPDLQMHFNVPVYPGQNYFGQFHEFEEGGSGVSFYYNGSERIFVSYQSGSSTYVDINLYDMKPVDEVKTNQPTDIPAEFVFKKAEYWILKPAQTQFPAQSDDKLADTGVGGSLQPPLGGAGVLCPKWWSVSSPLNFYRCSAVYNVPASLSVAKMCEHLFPQQTRLISHLTREPLAPDTGLADLWDFVSRDPRSNKILDIDFDVCAEDPGLKEIKRRAASLKEDAGGYIPTMNLFEAFERQGGVQKIIDVIIKALTMWKNKEKAQKWFVWVQELSSFSSLPHFFGLFMKNKECIDLLFQILAGTPDMEDVEQAKPLDGKKPGDKGPAQADRKWEEQEHKAVRFSYQVLSDVFRVDNDAKIRDFALENQLIERILDRIGIISKEQKRKWAAEVEVESGGDEERKKDTAAELKTNQKQEDYKKKIVKKKGVGYASDHTGQN